MTSYVRPALRTALQNASGAIVDDTTLASLVNRFANGAEVMRVDCAYLSASADTLWPAMKVAPR